MDAITIGGSIGGKARYRTQRRVLLQLRLTAGMVNVKKLFTLTPELRQPPVPEQHVHAPRPKPAVNHRQPPKPDHAEEHFFGSHLVSWQVEAP